MRCETWSVFRLLFQIGVARYPVAGTPTEVRHMEVLATGILIDFVFSRRVQEAQHEPWSGACRNVMNDARVQLTRACLGGTVLTPQPRCIDVSRLIVDAMVCAVWPSAQYERGSSSFTVRDWRVGRKTQGCQKVSAGW
jgi:hypothetical protein